METRKAMLTTAAAGILALLAVALLDDDGKRRSLREPEALPGEPHVEVIAPRNGSRHTARSVVVRVEVDNFRMAPARFGGEPQLGEGHIRFSLNRVPDCVEPAKLERAEKSPLGGGRLVGASFDFAEYAGPNGLLAERIGTQGSYSPATRPEIYYHELPAGFYRIVITLAENNGTPTPHHTVTNFQVLTPPGHELRPCPPGKVTSAKAAAFD